MKRISTLLLFLLTLLTGYAQNPFATYGYKPKMATLSNGRFDEFHDKDRIIEIGSVKFDTKTNKIVGPAESDTLDTVMDIQTVSRFISIDPEAERYYSISPYAYCMNNPIMYKDPTGKVPIETIWDIANVVYDLGAAIGNHIAGDHSTAKSHWIDLGLDVVATITPYVPAGTTKALKAGDKTVDAIKAVDKIEDVSKTAKLDKELKIDIPSESKIDRSILDPPTKPGNAPTFKKDNTPVEIHHEGQNPSGPFKEMHRKDHRGAGNDKVNHPNKNSPSSIDRKEFNKAKREYWRNEYGDYFNK